MTITTEDRVAFLREGVAVHSVHADEFGTRVYATGDDEERARGAIKARLGDDVEVTVCGDVRRGSVPRACVGHMEREEGRLQLRYVLREDEHLDELLVAEDDERVAVYGTVCVPCEPAIGDEVGHPYHVYLKGPLGQRAVFDAVAGAPVQYFNVYDGIFERVAAMQALRAAADSST